MKSQLLIAAAGMGVRLGCGGPKALVDIEGKPIVVRTLIRFAALGLDEGELFSSIIEENTVSLSSGDVLVFYTDGITEAMNVRDEEYGEERLMKCISDNSHLPSKQMVDQITADVNHFAGTQPQHDDITLVVMRVLES